MCDKYGVDNCNIKNCSLGSIKNATTQSKNHSGSKQIIHKLKNKYKFSAIMKKCLISFEKSKLYVFGIFKSKAVHKGKQKLKCFVHLYDRNCPKLAKI